MAGFWSRGVNSRQAFHALAVAALALCAWPAAGAGIDFFHGSFEQAVAEADRSGKRVFVDVYTDWCAPCKRMAKTVFVLDDVGDTFNRHFVSYKLNAEDAAQNGPQLAERFAVKSYPTYLFLDGSGELLAKKGGAMSSDAFKALALTAIGLGGDLASACAAYEGGDHGIDAFLQCFSRKVIAARELEREEMLKQSMALGNEYEAYFDTVAEAQLLTPRGFRLIANAPTLKRGDAAAEFLVNHYEEYAQFVQADLLARTAVELNRFGVMAGAYTNPDKVDQWVEDIRGVLAEAYAMAGRDEDGPADVYEWEKAGLQASKAVRAKDWQAFLAAEQHQLQMMPATDRTEGAAYIGKKLLMFRCEDPTALRVGAGYVALALDIKESFSHTVLYGQLLGKLEQPQLAQQMFDRARALIVAEPDEKRQARMTQELEQAQPPTQAPAAASATT